MGPDVRESILVLSRPTDILMRKAFVLVNTELGAERELQSELRKIRGIVGVHQVYGVYDLMVEIEAESAQELKDIVFSKIRSLGLVKSTLTLTAVS